MYNDIDSTICNSVTSLYFKTSQGVNQFSIDASHTTPSQVSYGFTCICCDVMPSKITGGSIKGKKADASRWLINAKIVQTTANGMTLDTMVVNQYFTPSIVLD